MEDRRASRRIEPHRIEQEFQAPMKLRASIDDYQTDIQILDHGSRLNADIANRRYELKVLELDGGDYLFIYDGGVFDCRVEGRPESGKTIDVMVGATRYAVALTDPRSEERRVGKEGRCAWAPCDEKHQRHRATWT